MRLSGTIIKWNDQKGFGFVAPDDHSDDVFVHLNALVERARDPRLGDRVFYELESKPGNPPRATRVVLRPAGTPLPPPRTPPPPSHAPPPAPLMPAPRFQSPRPAPAARMPKNPPPRSPARGPWPERRSSGSLLLLLLLPANVLGALWLAAQRGFLPPWVAIGYTGMSALTVLAYALDKYRAQKGKWRISESTLHLCEMAGGWPGAFVAQRLLRHKTRKLPFQVTYWIIVLAHLVFWGWFANQHLGLGK